jgi:hypothetical protein
MQHPPAEQVVGPAHLSGGGLAIKGDNGLYTAKPRPVAEHTKAVS